jgi:hypothetical protein
MVSPAKEQQEVATANESGRRPVVFVHGLWLLASSWTLAHLFEVGCHIGAGLT